MAGEIKNNVGLKVIETFGLDNQRVCKIFNEALAGKVESGGNVSNPRFNRSLLQSMIRGSIGYGYHYTHLQRGGKIKSFPMTQAKCDASTNITNVTVHYGGKTGTGQRIDITVKTPVMELKFNIRDTSGSSLPYQINCNRRTSLMMKCCSAHQKKVTTTNGKRKTTQTPRAPRR